MYCSACGTPVTAGLSYCNRCGRSLRERSEPRQVGAGAALLVAIILIGLGGLGIMLGGAFALTTEAHLKEELVGIFMLFTFLIIAVIEIFLLRQLSRLFTAPQTKASDTSQLLATPGDFRLPEPRALAEPLASVTENTTRTLEYSRNEPVR